MFLRSPQQSCTTKEPSFSPSDNRKNMDITLKNFLKELKQFGIENDIPNITETNAQFLHFLLRQKKAKSLLEIGTANGYSTIWFADAMRPFNGHITTIDLSEHSFRQALKNFEEAGVQDSITLLFGNALQILAGEKPRCDLASQQELADQYNDPNLPQKTFDVVFMDAQKKYYADFWELIQPMIHQDSLVIVDDILKFPEKTASFIEKMEQQSEFEYTILPIDEDDGIMLIHKRP